MPAFHFAKNIRFVVEKSKIIPFFNSALLQFRRLLVVSMVVTIATFAFFWENLPDSLKTNVTFLSTKQSDTDTDGMVPQKYRIYNQTEIEETEETNDALHESTEYRNTHLVEGVLDDATFSRLQDELNKLGVTYCRLTYWGDNENMYRFSCQVPFSEYRQNVTRTFQSIDPDAAQAIQDVIEQIRQWRSGRN